MLGISSASVRLLALASVLYFGHGDLPCLAQNQGPDAALRPATTVQQPSFGVSVNARGILTAARFLPDAAQLQQRLLQAKSNLPPDVFAASPLRKISLKRLTQTINQSLASNNTPDAVISHLAGLVRIEYALILPDEQDVILAGPAEGWIEDQSGRTVGIRTGWPTVLLEDLATALRSHQPQGNGPIWVGCSIEPTQDAMAKLVQFNRTIPTVVPERSKPAVAHNVVQGTRNALGMANIRVFGIPSNSHMAEVMIEADYRMKLIALGIEPPPIAMPTFFSRLTGPPRSPLQRWWFQGASEMVRLSSDRRTLQLVGETVPLSTESYASDRDGRLYATGVKPSGPASTYARAFTDRYDEISQASPAFKQMRNMVDLLVVAAYFRQEQAFESMDLDSSLWYAPDSQLLPDRPEPKKVACAVNARWASSRLVAASGGVSIDASAALDPQNILDDDGKLEDIERQLREQHAAIDHWWWG